MSCSFEVYPHSEEAFYSALSGAEVSAVELKQRPQPPYLLGYLNDIGAKAIVVEHGYIDGDYLDDYAAYYSRCFEDYNRKCKRLHFFSRDISAEAFKEALVRDRRGPVSGELESSYLGFVVARPLPTAVVGRTALRPYPSNNHRHFPCVCEVRANLFGLRLKVESLPFQEQDSATAACATTAIWCALQKAAELFAIAKPKSVAITLFANQVVSSARALPSRGLNVEQMCAAVRHAGLAPEVVEVRPDTPLASLIYSYLRMGLPVILGLDVEGNGLHAVAVSGYSIETGSVRGTEAHPLPPIRRTGLRISKFYAHDDQVGPFSRIEIDSPPSTTEPMVLRGWAHSGQAARRLTPKVVIVPLYEKIRLSFLDMQEWVYRLGVFAASLTSEPQEQEWDVHLITTNQLKDEFRAQVGNDEEVGSVVLRQHPRFIWRMRLLVSGSVAADFLADATGLAYAFPIYQAVWFDNPLRQQFGKWLCEPKLEPSLRRSVLGDRLFEFLRKSCSP